MRFKNETLKQCREQKGWTIHEATYQLRERGFKVTHPTLKSWEDGATVPDGEQIGTLCKIYGIGVEDFYEEGEDDVQGK